MNNRPKNYAPKNISGHSYYITVYENKVVIEDIGDNKKTIVKCHPDDAFDIGEAVRIGMDRFAMDDIIRVGDTIKVVDCGESYTTIRKWPIEYCEYAIRYRYGVCPENGTIGKVVGKFEDKYIVQVEKEHNYGEAKYNHLSCYDSVYLLRSNGINKIKDGRYE